MRTQIWIISLQGGLGPTVSEVMPISICSPKNMGKKLPNELWARPVASKLSERRPLTFFHRPDTENGQKRYFFAFLQITPMPLGNCMKMGAIIRELGTCAPQILATVVARIFQLFGVVLYTTLEIEVPCLGRT